MTAVIPLIYFSTLFVDFIEAADYFAYYGEKKNTNMRKGRSALPLKLKKKMKTRLYPVFLILLPIFFSVIVFFGYQETKLVYYQNEIEAMERQLNSIFQILRLYDDRVQDRSLSLPEAENEAKTLLAGPKLPDGTRDSGAVDIIMQPGESFLVFNSQGKLIVHSHLEGQNLFHMTDSEGRMLAREVLHKGNSVISYPSQIPGSQKNEKQIAVVRYFPQWDWHVSLVTSETNFYHKLSNLQTLLIVLVLGSYFITVILFYNTQRKDKALLSSKLRGEQLVETNQSILKTLAVALEERDAYTSGHSQRVAFYMRIIGEQMNFDSVTLDTIYTGGLLHDIGKIGIEDSILLKPGRLTEEEYAIIQSHPVRGEAILKRLYAESGRHHADEIEKIMVITRHHHERFDGKGYPDRLAGEDIPIWARIAAVADSFDAMTSSRAYRKGLSFSKACDELIQHAGTQFCPTVVRAFFECVTEETFYRAHQISRANELLDRIQEKRDISLQRRVSL